jgi:hypothetical protein
VRFSLHQTDEVHPIYGFSRDKSLAKKKQMEKDDPSLKKKKRVKVT